MKCYERFDDFPLSILPIQVIIYQGLVLSLSILVEKKDFAKKEEKISVASLHHLKCKKAMQYLLDQIDNVLEMGKIGGLYIAEDGQTYGVTCGHCIRVNAHSNDLHPTGSPIFQTCAMGLIVQVASKDPPDFWMRTMLE